MASQEDKPFACSVPGCGQCFANSDHLAVHQQKHELSLKFGSRQEVVMDQTPTPTRFLKNIEESGLFDELQTNPFDQDFKQAAQAGKGKNFPSTPIRIQLPGVTLTVPSSIVASQLVNSHSLVSSQISQDSTISESSSQEDSSTEGSSQIPITIPVAPPANIANPDKEVPKATAPHNSTASTSIKQLREALQKKVSSSVPQFKAPFITIPATPEILQQALSTVLPASGLTNTTFSATPTVGQTITMETDGGMNSDSSAELTPRRRRKYSETPPEEPEEKRQKFLERNRAAAMRCRQKKKVWVENLEKKSKDLEQTNNQLQNEVTYLRNEVHQLKTILLAHKDCPLIISQQQQIARVIQQLGTVVTPTNSATVEAATKLASSQGDVTFITTSLAQPIDEATAHQQQQQLEKLIQTATSNSDTNGPAKNEQ
ncbi:cyclic AMP-dependent transcription factor ATF-2-like isoform X2 [Dysidea avara]|uniref:cyclic AMP-dependent transcription factor ATF-2-like isoform X2 n=1 Tax=Dysidea avara TaxID=196820 RepID=UPI00331932C3